MPAAPCPPIVDQNLDFPTNPQLGSDVVGQLVQRGFTGLARARGASSCHSRGRSFCNIVKPPQIQVWGTPQADHRLAAA